jgi:hypothetical protein
MTRSGFVRAFCTGLLCLSLPMITACGVGPESSEPANQAEQTGTLSLPLSVTVGDHVYRFGYFQLYVYGYGYISSSGDPDETRLTMPLPTGRYDAGLWGWSLERDNGSGSFSPVNASLVSSSSVGFEILNGSTTTLSFQFETDGQIITVGSGNLAVTAEIDELEAACAPLGSDCGEGLWCPPGELTGSAVGCRYAGAVELGQPCNGPADCVSNSSCIDVGAGPVCAALCARAEFDSACPTGGICTAVGGEYGVCAP